jgi:hypothetical protein
VVCGESVPGSVVVLPVVAGGVAMVPEVPVVPAALLPIVSVLVPVVPVLLVPMLSVLPVVPVDVPLAVALVSVLPMDEVAVAGGVSVVVVLLHAARLSAIMLPRSTLTYCCFMVNSFRFQDLHLASETRCTP